MCSYGCVLTYILLCRSVNLFVLTPVCLCLTIMYIEIYTLLLDLRNIYTCVSLVVNTRGSMKHLKVYMIFFLYV